MTTSKVEETLQAIEGRKEYYLKKRQDVKDGVQDEPEASSSSKVNGLAASSSQPNGTAEDFEHVSSFELTPLYRTCALCPISIMIALQPGMIFHKGHKTDFHQTLPMGGIELNYPCMQHRFAEASNVTAFAVDLNKF